MSTSSSDQSPVRATYEVVGNLGWANMTVTLTNQSSRAIHDPEIQFNFEQPVIVRMGNGLESEFSDTPIDIVYGKLVPERKTIPAGGSQSFVVGLVGNMDVPYKFLVNRQYATTP